jgi:hypothetical protein
MTIAAACGIMLAAGVLTFRAQADEWDKKTILTIDQPIQVTDTYLEPGTYVFKLANSSSDRHIVYIYNRDQNHLINTVMAIPNYRLQPTGNSRFTFWETPPGTARAMRAWFYPGDNFGQEFRYPAHLRQLAAVTETRTVTETAQVTPPPAPVAEVAPPAPAPEVREEVKEETRTEIAQATPPPPAAVEEPAPPPPVEQPKELPKTASPYPLIGLCGLLSLGSYALLRIKRVA